MRVALNGFGRIGRMILRSKYEQAINDIDIVAINDLAPLDTNVHLLKRDTVHGVFLNKVSAEGNVLHVDDDQIKVFSERDPNALPWGELDIDVVLECTGIFRTREKAMQHVEAGAKKVLISAPAADEVDATIVFGVNHNVLKSSHTIVSNASCTTNCLAPLAHVLNEAFGIKHGLMTTIHAVTNGQHLVDNAHKDIRRARSAMENLIPTKTGAATMVGLVLPELAGKLDGFAIRVPTTNVSIVDLTFHAKRETSVEEVNEALRTAATSSLKGILGVCDEPWVSTDYVHDPRSSIVDSELTKVMEGTLVKVCSWYDNEWGYSSRMLDTAKALMSV